MKGIVLIRDLLYLYTVIFFCDWLALKKSISVLPCIIYLGASEGYLLVYVSISMFHAQSICTNSIVSFPRSIFTLNNFK